MTFLFIIRTLYSGAIHDKYYKRKIKQLIKQLPSQMFLLLHIYEFNNFNNFFINMLLYVKCYAHAYCMQLRALFCI